MTELELRQNLVKIAKSYLGCNEEDNTHRPIIDLYNSLRPLPVGYKMSYTDAWCAAYVSAMGLAAGLNDIVFPECSCDRMLKLYQKANLWVENDAYVPQLGDVIFYDWDDSGSGDNLGYSDHVGLISSIEGNTMTVIEGNYSNSVKERTLKVNSKNIRGFGTPNFASKVNATPTIPVDQTTSSVFRNIKTGEDLAKAMIEVAEKYKTLYVMGCFGAPLNAKHKSRYCNNYDYNKDPERTAMIIAASDDTFGFDCVCLIKGLLWGWNGNINGTYGGASYASNGVPDIGTESIITKCSDISTDFNNIQVGELCWMQGHVGIYVGDGLSVECTPAWTNNVQFTACNRTKAGYNRRNWTKHGKLPYVTYNAEPEDTYTYEKFIQEIQAIMGVPLTGKGDLATLNATVTISAFINQSHPLVKPVQKYLYALGYTEVGAADGIAGAKFTKAVAAFQVKNCDMDIGDGELTAKGKTWKKLINYSSTVEQPKQDVEQDDSSTDNTPITTPVWQLGDEVKLAQGAKYANGKQPLSWVYSSKLYIRGFRENESAIISTQKAGPITGIVYLKVLKPFDSAYDIIVTANLLNVRSDANINGKIINQIKKDTKCTIYEESNGWGHIVNSGWISLNYTKKV